ncbi:MAG: acyl-CoA/acyl-ACP dehydrogenase [Dehalococcoidales bacterium]|nr:acyl-CoA/acyl-ACP dehydrogenase [Dehalococcoidales bacterium]
MEFILNEEQEMLKTMARDFLENECPKTLVRQMMEDEVGHSPELWKKMAEVGWLGLVFPEKYGGSEMNFRDLTILCEEMGRAMMPGPFFSTLLLAGIPILEAGTEEQKQEFLPKIASGDIVCTLAVLEEDGDFWPDAVQIKATPRGGDYIISGTKMFVPDAKAADYILVAARTGRSANPEEGITLFMVDATEWGVYVTPLLTMDETRKQYELMLNRVAVPASNIIGEVNQGWPILESMALKARAALCAEMVGGGEWVLETTVNYAKDRIAFGVPIGSFQSIKHKCADMHSGLEYARSLMEWAAEAIKDGSPDTQIAVSMAKSYCGDVYKAVCGDGIQLHGGIGFTWDHDMHLYFKRSRAADAAFGDATYHRGVIAKRFG